MPLGTPHTVIPLEGAAAGDAAELWCPAERLQDPDSMAPRSRSARGARAALAVAATGGAGGVSAGQARQRPAQFHSLENKNNAERQDERLFYSRNTKISSMVSLSKTVLS